VREAFALLLLACACGVAARAAPVDRRVGGSSGGGDTTGESAGTYSSPSELERDGFAEVEARGPTIASGMREVARRTSAGDQIELVRAEGRDTCVRVAFAAGLPVVAKLVDSSGQVVASTGTASTEGVLGETGPVCMRKGDSMSAVTEGVRGPVRWVAWASP
jgi:hypothetical protein